MSNYYSEWVLKGVFVYENEVYIKPFDKVVEDLVEKRDSEVVPIKINIGTHNYRVWDYASNRDQYDKDQDYLLIEINNRVFAIQGAEYGTNFE